MTGFQGTFYGEVNLHIDSQGGGATYCWRYICNSWLAFLICQREVPKRKMTRGKTLNPLVDITHIEICKRCYFVKRASDGISSTVFEVVIWMLMIFHHSISVNRSIFLKYISCGIQWGFGAQFAKTANKSLFGEYVDTSVYKSMRLLHLSLNKFLLSYQRCP